MNDIRLSEWRKLKANNPYPCSYTVKDEVKFQIELLQNKSKTEEEIMRVMSIVEKYSYMRNKKMEKTKQVLNMMH